MSTDYINDDEINTLIRKIGGEKLGELMEILVAKKTPQERSRAIKYYLFIEINKRLNTISIWNSGRIWDIIDNFVNLCLKDTSAIDCDIYYSGNTRGTCTACAGVGFTTQHIEIENPLRWMSGNTSRKCHICQGLGYVDPTISLNDRSCGDV